MSRCSADSEGTWAHPAYPSQYSDARLIAGSSKIVLLPSLLIRGTLDASSKFAHGKRSPVVCTFCFISNSTTFNLRDCYDERFSSWRVCCTTWFKCLWINLASMAKIMRTHEKKRIACEYWTERSWVSWPATTTVIGFINRKKFNHLKKWYFPAATI